MHTPIPFPTSALTPKKTHQISVVLAYENLSAALWGAEALKNLVCRAASGIAPRVLPWNFSSFANPSRRDVAVAAAQDSDLIIIAASSCQHALPETTVRWLKACLSRQRATLPAVAAVFNDFASFVRGDCPPLLTVQQLADEAGCEFVPPAQNELTLNVA